MKNIGCLLIHGFTSHRSSLEAVIPELDKRHIPWHYPILAGHGTTPKDLEKTNWEMWQNDVEQGLQYVLGSADRVVIIALSMGALLGLELAEKHPNQVSGIILLSPCLHFYTKLANYTPLLTKIIKKFPNPSLAKFSSLAQAKHDRGYTWFPTSAFKHFWQRTKNFDQVIKAVHQPILIVHSKKDKVAAPSGAQHIFDTLGSKEKQLIWLEESGHEILLDNETPAVIQHITAFKKLTE